MILQNAGSHSPSDSVSHPRRRLESQAAALWELRTEFMTFSYFISWSTLPEIWTNLKCFWKLGKSHFYFWRVIFNIFSLFVTCMNLVACLTCTHLSARGLCGLWFLRDTQPSARQLCGLWCLRGHTFFCQAVVWPLVFEGAHSLLPGSCVASGV